MAIKIVTTAAKYNDLPLLSAAIIRMERLAVAVVVVYWNIHTHTQNCFVAGTQKAGIPSCGEVHAGDLWWVAKEMGVGLYPSPQWVESADPRGGYFLPRKNANYMQKRLNLVHIFVYFSYFNIIVDSKLPGDLVHAPGAGRLTPWNLGPLRKVKVWVNGNGAAHTSALTICEARLALRWVTISRVCCFGT